AGLISSRLRAERFSSARRSELATPVLLHLVAEDSNGNQVSRLPISFTTHLAGSMGATIVGTDVSRTVTAHLQMSYQMPPAERVDDGWQALVGQLKLGWRVRPDNYRRRCARWPR
ncbi:hypothetical protein, partial [Micromonospora sp. RL09-050-HVF-A]|uniref:hypothetical protein n=1 Tax=Micromonospora sp. RL09-050-HVF-A TaxID=1703433 RepID=UPI001C5D51B6